MEKVAGAVTAQLARRDIFVTDVEIFEYTKKQVTFRETKGGIVIKNKKFSMDGENIVSQDVSELIEPKSEIVSVKEHPHNSIHPHNNVPAKQEKFTKVRRTVVFLPSQPGDIQEVRKNGYSFTPEKKYPVYFEAPHPYQLGVNLLTTVDDNGKQAKVSDVYFVPAETNLIADKELGFSKNNGNMVPDEKLVWTGVVGEMIDIRKGKK